MASIIECIDLDCARNLIRLADAYKAIFGTITPKAASNANAPKLYLRALKSDFEKRAKASSKMLEKVD